MSIFKNIIGLFFIMLFVGCVKDESMEDIVFHVDVSEINAYSATVTVTHNASNRDSYYGFTVKGAVDDIQSEIADFLSTVQTSQLAEAIHFQRKSVFSITGLSPKETYTFIVFGMNVGTCCTLLVVSATTNRKALRTAMAHQPFSCSDLCLRR